MGSLEHPPIFEIPGVPDHLTYTWVAMALLGILALVASRRLEMVPRGLQNFMEIVLEQFLAIIDDVLGHEGRRYLPLLATLGLFIVTANLMGLVPGLMAPTANINVTVGLAITTWVYYHFQGFKKQGVVNYLKHFAVPPGAPVWMAPLMLLIELISHTSRLLSLSLRLFGNIFGEELVIVILGSIIPFVVPLPMMLLGLITGGLQAFIFVLLSIIYLQAAVAVEHEHDAHGHDAPTGHHAPAAA